MTDSSRTREHLEVLADALATPGEGTRERVAEDVKLVRRLERLARSWPDGYMLASMGGSLCLFRTDDRFVDDGGPGLDPEKALWSTGRIPNTGGDW